MASLHELIVLEMGYGPGVAFAARLLADAGCTVVKVEDARNPDPTRKSSFFAWPEASPESSVLFHYLNSGKLGVCVDCRTEATRELIRRLIERADLVFIDRAFLELYGSMVHEAVRSAGTVVVAVTPFGTTGPYSDYDATGRIVFAASGEASMLPGGLGYELFPEAPPLLVRGRVVDYIAGTVAALVGAASLCGVLVGERRGAFIDIAEQETELSLNRWLISQYTAFEWVESRATRAYRYGGMMPCKDGYVMFQPTTDWHWTALVRMMGNPEWAQDARFADVASRAEHGREINQRLREWASGLTKAELLTLGLEHECPVGPFRRVDEIADCAQLRARGFFRQYRPSQGAPVMPWPGLPFRLSEENTSVRGPAPALGEHTRHVLSELLGLPDEKIDELERLGLVLCGPRSQKLDDEQRSERHE